MKLFLMLLSLLVAGAKAEKLNILIITGGHGFEVAPFFAMFDELQDVSWDSASHPLPEDVYAVDKLNDVDVLVFYDMNQAISERQKSDLLGLARSGKGLLFLHHSLASYQNWDEFRQLLGGRYYLKPVGAHKASTYRHDMDFRVLPADTTHPVLQGLSDFAIHDEVYGSFEVLPDAPVLLRTDHPESGNAIGWVSPLPGSRIIYLQPGHDHFAYENKHYRRLLRNALFWLAGKEAP